MKNKQIMAIKSKSGHRDPRKKNILFNTACNLLFQGRSPGQLVIQLTDKCNARCPQCGMRTTNKFHRTVMDTDIAKGIIDHAAEQGVQSVSFTGGEPFLVMDLLLELIRHAQKAGIPYIRTGTNGYFFMQKNNHMNDKVNRIAEALAETGLYTFWISIDSSCRDTHEKMRGLPGVIDGIEKSLPVFHDHGIYPAANLGINRNMAGEKRRIGSGIAFNDPFTNVYYYEQCWNALESYYRFVTELGFTMTSTCYPMSMPDTGDAQFDPVYSAVSSDSIIKFSNAEKAQLYRALFDIIPKFRPKIRIFTPRSSLYGLISERRSSNGSYGCLGGIDYYFIECSNGDTYPCGYRGSENLGKFRDIDIKKRKANPECRLCDWECFRDPSAILGPVMGLRTLVNCLINEREFYDIWREDIRYYKACGFFNGREPSAEKLQNFKSKLP